jgi:hypothetical protein
MRFDFTGADLFLAYLRGDVSAREVLEHPAYAIVCQHANHFGGVSISPRSLEQGLQGLSSPFYGLSSVRDNLPQIHKLITELAEAATDWAATAADELSSLLPDMDTDGIVVYPIIGYDAGIGLSEAVCMNLNYRLYHEMPEEFLSTLIHEGFHVLHQRIHGLAQVHELTSASQWRDLCLMMLQNEGLAVYAPYPMRQRRGYSGGNSPMQLDYSYLNGDLDIGPLTAKFCSVLDLLSGDSVSDEERLEAIFGADRLLYRVGSVLAKRVKDTLGASALASATKMPPETYWQTYAHLIIR